MQMMSHLVGRWKYYARKPTPMSHMVVNHKCARQEDRYVKERDALEEISM